MCHANVYTHLSISPVCEPTHVRSNVLSDHHFLLSNHLLRNPCCFGFADAFGVRPDVFR